MVQKATKFKITVGKDNNLLNIGVYYHCFELVKSNLLKKRSYNFYKLEPCKAAVLHRLVRVSPNRQFYSLLLATAIKEHLIKFN